MIETKEGYERVVEIAKAPNLDGFYIGPSDLSLAFDLEPGQDKTDEPFPALVDHNR